MSTIDELHEIERSLAAYWVAGDSSFHAKVLSEDWSVIDPTGREISKAEVLATSFSGMPEPVRCQIDDIKVRDFGEWAVVTGRNRGAVRHDGNEMEFTLRFTDVFDRGPGEWRCVASQGTFTSE